MIKRIRILWISKGDWEHEQFGQFSSFGCQPCIDMKSWCDFIPSTSWIFSYNLGAQSHEWWSRRGRERERGRKAFTFCIELKETDRGRIWHMKLEYNVSGDEEQQHGPPPAYFWLVWDREKTTRAFGCILIAACIISRNNDRKHKIEQIRFFSVRFRILRPHKEIGITERNSRELIITAY